MHGVGQRPLLVLVRLPDVEEGDSPALQQGFRVGLVHLADGRLGLVQQVSGSSHSLTSGLHQPAQAAGLELSNTTNGVNIPWGLRPGGLLSAAGQGRPCSQAVENCPPMELHEAIRRRAMVRSFSPEPVDPAWWTGSSGPPCAHRPPATRAGRRGSCSKGPSRPHLLGRHLGRGLARQHSGGRGLRRAPVILFPTPRRTPTSSATAKRTRRNPLSGSGQAHGPCPTGSGTPPSA